MITIGIDPGLSGAIVAILPSGEIEFHDIPILEVKKRQTLNYAGLAHILRWYPSRGECRAAIELVGAMPGQGVSSMFKFMARPSPPSLRFKSPTEPSPHPSGRKLIDSSVAIKMRVERVP